jgi:hypothetical protein
VAEPASEVDGDQGEAGVGQDEQDELHGGERGRGDVRALNLGGNRLEAPKQCCPHDGQDLRGE